MSTSSNPSKNQHFKVKIFILSRNIQFLWEKKVCFSAHQFFMSASRYVIKSRDSSPEILIGQTTCYPTPHIGFQSLHFPHFLAPTSLVGKFCLEKRGFLGKSVAVARTLHNADFAGSGLGDARVPAAARALLARGTFNPGAPAFARRPGGMCVSVHTCHVELKMSRHVNPCFARGVIARDSWTVLSSRANFIFHCDEFNGKEISEA